MSVSAVTNSIATKSSASASIGGNRFSHEDFLSLLVNQLRNQNPLEPTSPDKVLDQMLGYADYGIQEGIETQLAVANAQLANLAGVSDQLSDISDALEEISGALDISA